MNRLPSLMLTAALLSLSGQTTAKQPAISAKSNDIIWADAASTQVWQAQARWSSSASAQKAQAEQFLVDAAQDRQALLLSLLKTDPKAATRMLSPALISARFPAKAQRFIERATTEEGEVSVFYADMQDASQSRQVYSLKTAGGDRTLHFASRVPPSVKTGARIRVHGVALQDQVVVLETSDVTLLRAPLPATTLPNTTGVQQTLVVLLNFADQPTDQQFTSSQAADVVFNGVNAFDMEASYQQFSLVGTATPWLSIPVLSTAACSPTQIGDAANAAAAAAGYDLNAYSRFIYVFPSNTCGWWGLGMMGGIPSRTWVQSRSGLATFTPQVLAHEMGHNLGLQHAQALDCGSEVIGSIGCMSNDYGDVLDVMGFSSSGTTPHYNAFHKERLGWLNAGISPPITTVSDRAVGQFALSAFEAPRSTAPRAVKVSNPTTCPILKSWYYIEQRTPQGQDAFLSAYPESTAGLLIHRVTDGSSSSSLLDMTPQTSLILDAPLPKGETFLDKATGLSLINTSTLQQSSVSVQRGAAQCVRGAPSVASSPINLTTGPGEPATTTVTVFNTDSCACAPAVYSVTAFPPTGWTVTTGQTPPIAPGASATATVSVNPPAGASLSSTTIATRATNSIFAASYGGSAVVVAVTNALKVTTATGTFSYTRPKGGKSLSVPITTTVSSFSDVPKMGAAVTVTVRTPTGVVQTFQGTTSALGQFTASYSLLPTSALGSYNITTSATLGTSAGTTSATFFVK